MVNDRIFYAVHQTGLAPTGVALAFTEIHGLQTMSMNLQFTLEQVFEHGQIEIYDNIENTPNVEISMEKVLDGYPPIYLLATSTAPSDSPTLAGRSTEQSTVATSIFPDTNDSATTGEIPQSQVSMSGMFIGSVGYTIPIDGPMTETVTMVGNDRLWTTDGAFTFNGAFDNDNVPLANGSGGVQFRENILFDDAGRPTFNATPNATELGWDTNLMAVLPSGSILPPDIFGITSSGTQDLAGALHPRLQNIAVNVDLGREDLFELGRRLPYTKVATFPTEVTCEITVLSTSGDLVSATEAGVFGGGSGACNAGTNLVNRTIKIATCDGLRLNLRYKNKLSSVTYTGGDATGGNVESVYSYSNFNALTVTHYGDPNDSMGRGIADVDGAWLNWYMVDTKAAPA